MHKVTAQTTAAHNVSQRTGSTAAIGGLLTGALVWGLIWYPLRALAQAGWSGPLSTVLIYALSFLVLIPFQWRALRQCAGHLPILALMGCTAGACNLGYVMAVLHGEVFRVLLLFYLAPLWTVVLSYVLLRERLTRAGLFIIVLSSAGAIILLWPAGPIANAWPWPRNIGEWLGLAAGFFFALSNVLSRRLHHLTGEVRSLAIFAGVSLNGLLLLAWTGVDTPTISLLPLLLLLVLVPTMVAVNLVVQYGLGQLPANQAIIFLLLELVVAGLGGWWLAHEPIGVHEITGGLMIVGASLCAGFGQRQTGKVGA